MTPTRVVALVGTLAVVAFATLAAVQILVLNPLAAAPERTLPEIHAELARWDESLGTPWVLGLLAIGIGLAAWMLVSAWRAAPSMTTTYLAGYLGLLVLGTPAYWLASFGAGMALADTFATTGGDHSPWAIPLYITSGIAWLSLVTLLVRSGVRSWRRSRGAVRPG